MGISTIMWGPYGPVDNIFPGSLGQWAEKVFIMTDPLQSDKKLALNLNLTSKVKSQSPPKTIGILTKVFCTFGPKA